VSAERYRRAAEVFNEARALAGAERDGFLEHACRDDPELREAVERLLEHDADAGGFVPDATGEPGARYLARQLATREAIDGAARPVPPTEGLRRVGRYEITRLIAVGGMGAVYEARQDQPRRTVAVKIIRTNLEARQARMRFDREAELLGQLQHPGITHVYEAGIAEVVAADGRASAQPFIAMEFIHGSTLDVYAREHDLDSAQRLELIAKVADAVHYAHQKGVIHRDLKPGNILVDGTGQPKILDFGVARATDADVQTVTMQTDVGQLIGTLPYMSPEQATGDSSRLDTRSDVYALGVVLYELLCGRLPLDLGNRSIPECARLIREEEPTQLGTVDTRWRGDVATIVAKTLEKDPAHRYQSAAELAADVRRHLRHEPITARSPSTYEQLRKFARRNRALVGGAAVTAVALLIGMIGTLWFAIGESRQRVAAERHSQRAEAVNEFLVSMLEEANPETNPFGREMSLPEVVDLAAARIEDSFRDQPAVEADVRHTIGRAYTALGRPAEAVAALRRAVELRREATGDERPDLAECLASLSSALVLAGEWDAARAAVEEALRINQETFGDRHESVVTCLSLLGVVCSAQADYVQAEAHHRRALETGRAVLGDDHRVMAKIHEGVAEARFHLGDLDGAETHFREAVRINRAALGEHHPVYASGMINLGVVLRNKGDLDGAEDLYRRSMSVLHRALGEEHLTVVSLMVNLARLLQARESYEEAEALLRDALAMRRQLLGDDHTDVSVCRRILANLYVAWGRYQEAEPLLRESLQFNRDHLGPEHMRTRSALVDLAALYTRQDRHGEAEPLYVDLVTASRRALPEDHWHIGSAELRLGSCRRRLMKYELGEQALLEAYRILAAAENAALRDRAARQLAALYDDWGRPDRAEAWRAKAPAAVDDGS
jgi:tetratricopeptide (TPR) repeat protein/tRNA A-37 threonylcarbamoyl transferase component Bud32